MPAGVTSVIFNVTIIEDSILEHNESFSLSVDPLTLPNRVTTGSSNHTRVTIIDDDSKLTLSSNHLINEQLGKQSKYWHVLKCI